MCVQVALGARSFRSPEPRKSAKDFPFRITAGKFLLERNRSEWRLLEKDEDIRALEKPYSGLPRTPQVLVSLFRQDPGCPSDKEIASM